METLTERKYCAYKRKHCLHFPDELGARINMALHKPKKENHPAPQRAYLCKCGSWHL